MRSSRLCSGSNSRRQERSRSSQTSTRAMSRASVKSATALTGRFPGLRTWMSKQEREGRRAPRQRRGREGVVGGSARRLAPGGGIGPWGGGVEGGVPGGGGGGGAGRTH